MEAHSGGGGDGGGSSLHHEVSTRDGIAIELTHKGNTSCQRGALDLRH